MTVDRLIRHFKAREYMELWGRERKRNDAKHQNPSEKSQKQNKNSAPA